MEVEKPMTQEVKAYQLRLVEIEKPFCARLARLVKAVWCKLFGKEGKTWNSKKW
jgi:hypothetical protein